MPAFVDLTGRRFGRLRVIGIHEKRRRGDGRRVISWDCACDCGKNTVVDGGNLGDRNSSTKSCGCYKLDSSRERMTTHGMTDSAEYNIWSGIKKRCEYKDGPSYKRYGAKGIKVCHRWSGDNGFLNFLTDMGRRPTNQHSIDRIDGRGDYCPENCRWATHSEQANNRSNVRLLEFDGEWKTLSEWCKELHLSRSRINMRLYHGWSFEEAVRTPKMRTNKRSRRRNRLVEFDWNHPVPNL